MIRDRRINHAGDLGTVKHEENGPDQAWDDVSGKTLDPGEVKKARADEMHYFKEFQVYKKVPESECWQVTGNGPIGTRWVDINKGDE